MLFGVESYFRVEIEELTELSHDKVYVSQNKDWAWDKLAWDAYIPNKEEYGSDILTFLNGNRTIIQDKMNGALNYIFSSKVLEYNEN